MARDILRDYGPDSPSSMAPRARSGGVMKARDVHNYAPPVGPTSIGSPQSPGLHGTNCGNCGTQGEHSIDVREGGSPGLHGENHGHGTNRRG